jgi:hypothetical protein
VSKQAFGLIAFLLCLGLGACSTNPSGPTPTAASAIPSPTAALPRAATATAPTVEPAGTAPGVDACLLLGDAEAEALLGAAVERQPSPISAPAATILSTCTYRPTAFALEAAELIVRTLATPAEAQEAYGLTLRDVQELGIEPQAVTGLGEEGHWLSTPPTAQLHVRQDNFILIFTVVTQQPDEAQMAAVATQALSRMSQ